MLGRLPCPSAGGRRSCDQQHIVTIHRMLLCFPSRGRDVFSGNPPSRGEEMPSSLGGFVFKCPGGISRGGRKINIPDSTHAPISKRWTRSSLNVQREEGRSGYKAQHGDSLAPGGTGSSNTKKRAVSNPSQMPAVRTDHGRSGKGAGLFFFYKGFPPGGIRELMLRG